MRNYWGSKFFKIHFEFVILSLSITFYGYLISDYHYTFKRISEATATTRPQLIWFMGRCSHVQLCASAIAFISLMKWNWDCIYCTHAYSASSLRLNPHSIRMIDLIHICGCGIKSWSHLYRFGLFIILWLLRWEFNYKMQQKFRRSIYNINICDKENAYEFGSYIG